MKSHALTELQTPSDKDSVPFRHEVRGKPYKPPEQLGANEKEDEIFDLIKRLNPSDVEDIAGTCICLYKA